jgi:putative transposase
MEIISHCVWLYHRFPLSFREVEEMMLEGGVVVSHETRRRGLTRDNPGVVPEVRADLRERTAPSTATSRG